MKNKVDDLLVSLGLYAGDFEDPTKDKDKRENPYMVKARKKKCIRIVDHWMPSVKDRYESYDNTLVTASKKQMLELIKSVSKNQGKFLETFTLSVKTGNIIGYIPLEYIIRKLYDLGIRCAVARGMATNFDLYDGILAGLPDLEGVNIHDIAIDIAKDKKIRTETKAGIMPVIAKVNRNKVNSIRTKVPNIFSKNKKPNAKNRRKLSISAY